MYTLNNLWWHWPQVVWYLLRKEIDDFVGNKPVKNDAGEMSMSKEAKQNVWVEHYERLLNVEFDWDPDHLSNNCR